MDLQWDVVNEQRFGKSGLSYRETGPERTLIGVVVKNDAENTIGYAVSVTLGAKATKVKLRESELNSCAVVRSAIKQTLGRLRQVKLDCD